MKKNRLFAIVIGLLLAVGLIPGISGQFTASAASLDEADLCLEQTIELTIGEGTKIKTLSYERQELFDYNLASFGYSYLININGSEGFALMINRGMFYEVTEIYENKECPYTGTEGLAVYLTPLSYIEYVNGTYYDIESGEALEEDILVFLSERGFGFEGGVPGETVTEPVSYTSKQEDIYKIPGTFPEYISANPALTNTCAISAGGVIMGYWGRYFPELMPNFTVGRPLGSSYYYNGYNDAVQAVMNDLYVKMGTNVGGEGTTATGFRNGMISYANSKGRNLTFTSVVSNNQLNNTTFKSHLNELRPIVLFFNTYNLMSETGVKTEGTTDYITRKYHSGMHIMVGCGYKFITYYSGSTAFRTDYYVRVATGNADMKMGYVKLYDGATMQEGYAINIY